MFIYAQVKNISRQTITSDNNEVIYLQHSKLQTDIKNQIKELNGVLDIVPNIVEQYIV